MTERAPGAGMLHPLAVASLLILVLNDQILKAEMPGALTGKLSDLAGLALVPLFLQAAFEVARSRSRGGYSAEASNRVLAGAALATALGFSLVELVPEVETVYRVGLGLFQWPFRAAACLASSAPLPEVRPVQATSDITDLLALPMAWVAQRAGRVRLKTESARSAATLVVSVIAATCAFPSRAAAAEGDYVRDGFYLGSELGGGVAYLSSTTTIHNGFRQRIHSTAFGRVFPSFLVDAGGTISKANLVLGGRFSAVAIRRARYDSNGHEFVDTSNELVFFGFQVLGHYYPDLTGGLYFGGALGVGSLDSSARQAERHDGYALSLEAGYRGWVSRNWSLGGVLRLSSAVFEGQRFGVTTLIAPTCSVTVAWH
ncbi:MAG: hypothetical protein M3020_11545 [Myxococcota bacterium]|nr:hypothetical protein [Myxococcota bacterium]